MGSDLSVIRAARVSYDAAWRAGEDEKSDVLIMFLLNGNNPGKFKHRQEITGANDGPVTFTLDIGTPNGDTV